MPQQLAQRTESSRRAEGLCMKLPKKLGRPPIVEAVFEMRFQPAAPLSNILPGLALSQLKADRIEKLPAAELPELLRKSDPNLRHAPLVRAHWGNFLILAGDQSAGLACKIPYGGWTAFKGAILNVVRLVAEVRIAQTIERFSIKYTNIVFSDLGKAPDVVNFALKVGKYDAAKHIFSIRAEIPRNGILCIVQIAADAAVTLPDHTTRTGVLVDIDTLRMNLAVPFSTFVDTLADEVEQLHTETKAMFFECLKPDVLKKMEPIYD
jgi:uncharacterized protein (TIGR04255 family)